MAKSTNNMNRHGGLVVKAFASHLVDLSSLPGQVITIDFKKSYSQLSCLTLSFKRTVWRFHLEVVDMWQLDSKTERSFYCVLAKATWRVNKLNR